MNEIRLAVAKAIGVSPDDLGCFTVMDHEGQPTVIVVHGEADAGVYVETWDFQRYVFKKVA